MRLQLELSLGRREAEACVRAGFTSAAEIAAADDAEFHRGVRLPGRRRGELLSLAREPRAPLSADAQAPRLSRDRRPSEAIVKVAKPVRDTVARLAGSSAPRAGAREAPKPAPPHAQDAHRRSRREAATEAEAELDEKLRDEG